MKPPKAEGEPLRVLLVEDNPADARLIREMLADDVGSRFEVAGAERLARARERLAEDRPAVILLDLSLPDAQGLETVRQMLAEAPDLPILVLTGLHDESVAIEAVHAGAQDYLIKGDVTGPLLSRAIRYAVERKRTESVLRLLAEAGTVLTSSVDYEDTLANVARLAVPRLADLCMVDLVEESGEVRRVEVAAARPDLREVAAELRDYPLDRHRPHLVWRVLGQREPELIPEVPDGFLVEIAQDERHLGLLRALEIQSFMGVPLLARGRMLGALTFVVTESSGRAYGSEDLTLALELAARAALAVDNARLYRDATGAVRARDEMLAIVSHDLRNPLNAISLGVSLVRTGLGPTAEVEDQRLAEVEEVVTGMDRLIQDLLDVTRLSAGRLPLHREVRRVGELLDAACEQLHLAAARKGVQVQCQVPDARVGVVVDSMRVLQVFGNLVGNAIKFTAAGGSVTVRAKALEGEVLFSVTDTGEGIPAEYLPHVFDRFWQGRRSDQRGAGLGLAIVKGIVEAHGGRVCAESEPGRGSTFYFTLPRPEPSAGSG